MKTLTSYINENFDQQSVFESLKGDLFGIFRFLAFCGGLTTMGVGGGGSILAIVGFIVMTWSVFWPSIDESLDDSEEMSIDEGMQDMAKDLLNKALQIDCVKKLIDNISKLDGYEELKKNKDIKGLVKLVSAYYKNHKDEIKEVNNALKKTQA